MRGQVPSVVWVRTQLVEFTAKRPGLLEGRQGDVVATIEITGDEPHRALGWQIRLHDRGQEVIDIIVVLPTHLRFGIDPKMIPVRVRYMTGSQHYDACCYPSRAFQLHERMFTTHDHARPVKIDGKAGTAHDYVSMLQLAVGPDTGMAGFMVGFQHSGPGR